MQRRKVTADHERDMVANMIMSDEFLKDIRLILDVSLIRSPYARRMMTWCVKYYEKYEEAPKEEMRSIFLSQKEYMDEDESSYMERVFETLPEPKSGNYTYRLDQAETYLKRRKLETLSEQIRGDLEEGDVARAENRVASFERVERPRGEGVDLFEDEDRVGHAIVTMEESMIFVPGVLGEMLGPFYSGDLVAVGGPPKRGKSWWLMFFAMCAVNSRLRVLFVSLEMLERQSIRRFVQMITSSSIRDQGLTVASFSEDDNGKFELVQKMESSEKFTIVRWRAALKELRRLNRESRLKILSFPQDTLNVEDLELHLENMAYFDGFEPDVIVVDYADIMAPERNASREYRHRLDQSWKSLRGLAQKRNCLVFTGTQTDRSTLRRDAGADNVAEDMRKLAHVAKMIGLNQSKQEKKLGVMRLGVWVERHDHSYETDEVVVTQALGIGKPYLDSRWKKDVEGVYDDSGSKGAK